MYRENHRPQNVNREVLIFVKRKVLKKPHSTFHALRVFK